MLVWEKINEILDNEFYVKLATGCWVTTCPVSNPFAFVGLSIEFQAEWPTIIILFYLR